MLMIASEAHLFQEIAPVRRQFYDLFGRLFAQVPDLDDVNNLALLSRQLMENMPVPASFGQGAERITNWCQTGTRDQLEIAAASEHTRRFCLGGGSIMPSASVFTSAEHSLKKQIWEDLCDFYRLHHYVLTDTSLLEDHIATLCFFMATLCGEAADPETGLSIQKQCLQRFVLPWITDFCDLLSRQLADEGANLYSGVGALLAGFIDLECRLFELDPENGNP